MFFLVLLSVLATCCLGEDFLDHDQLMEALQGLEDQHPNLATVYVLGESAEGRQIKVNMDKTKV